MRAIVPLLAAACLLTVVGASLAEFDAGPAKPTQAAGATFGDGTASKRPAKKGLRISYDSVTIRVALAPQGINLTIVPPETRSVRTPRTHRPANTPSRPYVEIIISCPGDGSVTITRHY
jgi:hypothetical protein